MVCKKCGVKIEKNWEYCPNCRENLLNENIETNKETIIEKTDKDKTNSMICIFVFLINIIALFTMDHYNGIFFILALISIVTGFIKYPNSKIIKVLFWLFLIGVILYVLLIIVLLITCLNMITNCDVSGMSNFG